MEQVYRQGNNENNKQFWNIQGYIMFMIVISYHLGRQNRKIWKFHTNSYSRF